MPSWSVQFFITREKLENTEHLLPEAGEGARVCFRGYVRDNNPYRGISRITAIEYHCYMELAEKEGMRILHEASARCDVCRIYCIHRIGLVNLQEASIHVEVVHAHRAQAFEAVQYVMDSIKKSLPVWKKEITIDGRKIWT